MNGTVPAPPPLAVGLAALAGLVLLLGGVALSGSAWWSRPARDVRREEPPGATRPAFPDDDLPGFRTAPPGTPSPVPAPGTATGAHPDGSRHRPAVATRRRQLRVLVGAAVAALLLGALLAAVVRGGRGPAAAEPSTAASSAPSSPPSSPPRGITARLTAGGLVLSRVPVGVTAGFPEVLLTARSGGAAVHLELPTANCLSPQPPTRPEDGGCLPTATEFADLGTPALRVTREPGRVTLSGRFLTRLGPDGAATGRAYDVTVSVDLPRPSGDAPLPTEGTVRIGGETAPTLPGPELTTLAYGG